MSTSALFKNFSIIAGATLATLGTLAPVQAANLTYNWLDNDTDTYGSITFNDAILDSNPDPLAGLYQDAIVSFTLTRGAFTRTVTNFTENLITFADGAVTLTGFGSTTGISGGKFRFTLDLTSAFPSISDRLIDFDPTSPLWSGKSLLSQVYYADGTIAAEARRELDTISAVPEPASAIALITVGALSGLVTQNRKRKKQAA